MAAGFEQEMDLEMIEGKRIIVTGGASGMGAALVSGYSKAGANIIRLMTADPAGLKHYVS